MSKLDYFVQVHLVEARDLKAEDPNGLSDPYAEVVVGNRTVRTGISKACTSVVWDEKYTFEHLKLTEAQFARENVHVQVYDANVLVRNVLIGQCSFGLKKIWGQTRPTPHRYQQWVALTLPDAPTMPSGYLFLSVTVLGVGDSPPPAHTDIIFGTDMMPLVKAPTIKRRGKFLSVVGRPIFGTQKRRNPHGRLQSTSQVLSRRRHSMGWGVGLC